MSPTKDEIVELLENSALLLELKGENPFRTRAYTNAARALETFPGDVLELARAGRMDEVPGVGKAVALKVEELVTTGTLAFYENLRAEFPETIFELFDLPGLGAKKIKALYENLQVSSISALTEALSGGQIATLAGFGAKTAANLAKAIEQRARHAGQFRLGDVAVEAEVLLRELREHPAVTQVSAAGSYRRRREVLHDLDFIVSTREPEQVMDFFTTFEAAEETLARGATKATIRLKSGVQADLRVVRDEEFAFALGYFTGSKEHNIEMRSRALKQGWTLNEYRLAPVEGKPSKAIPPVRTEAELYGALGLPFIEPELRENLGEFAAAETDTLPRLVELENLRGTFHNHTVASDGRSTLAEMAEAARETGLQYLGIADHSQSSVQAHGLSVAQLLAQRREIDALNETFAGKFRLFAGVECDIAKNGSLDYPDEILAQLDYVVASVHASFTLPEAEMTKRLIRAMSNPHVTMLGHVSGRLLLTREPYQVNIPAIIEAAAETGTIIELNAHPRRLDMDWRYWRLAKEKGVKCAINPDAHHVSGFQHLWFGIAAARKGWLERTDVVNCLPLVQIEAALGMKTTEARRRGGK